MKSHLLATVSTLALVSAASAADIPARPYPAKAPVAAPVVWNWTGFYVGINGGAVWHKADVTVTNVVGGVDSGTLRPVGGTFGGQIGYNWQSGNIVYGVEADVNWVDASKSGILASGAGSGQFSTKLSWLATVRGRLGITVTPPTFLYVTGGYAAGGVKNNVPSRFGGFPEDSSTRSGWTVGGGIEYMINPKWTVKAEALYVDLGDKINQGNLGVGYIGRYDNTAVIARAGINLKW